MRVAELPASVSILSEAGEEASLLDVVPGRLGLTFAPRSPNHRQLRSERIDA